MLKRVALMLTLAALVVAEAEAGRFRGGCPNGQCSVQAYYPTQKVAQTQAPAKQQVALASATEAAPEAVATTSQAAQQPQYVASQAPRRTFFRRWSR